jgi:AcrR family transcriptional regulator
VEALLTSQAPGRERLLQAALPVFVERGVVGASIEEICARSGASVGSLYHHFGDKDGLAGAVYVAALGDYQRAFLAELREHAEAESGIRAGVVRHLRWCLRERPQQAHFLLFEGGAARGASGASLEAANREFLAGVRAWWRPHVAYGVLRDLDLDLAYALWLGPAQEHCRLSLSGRTSVSAKRAERVLADGAWRALRNEGG